MIDGEAHEFGLVPPPAECPVGPPAGIKPAHKPTRARVQAVRGARRYVMV